MKKLILLILIAATFNGCVTQKRCNNKFPPETIVIRTDSIIRTTETVFRDTTVYIHLPGEVKYSTDTVTVVNGIIQSGKSHLFTSFADSWAWVSNGHLYHDLTQKDTLIGYEVKDAIRMTLERAERYYKENQTIVVTKKYVPLFYKIIAVIAGIFIVYYILRIMSIFK